MKLAYELRCGSYYLIDLDEVPNRLTGERGIRLMTDTVALCFDRESGMLLKHGRPHLVESWWRKHSEAYRAIGLEELVANVVVVSGAFPLVEINKCLSTSGYCKLFMEKLSSMIPSKIM